MNIFRKKSLAAIIVMCMAVLLMVSPAAFAADFDTAAPGAGSMTFDFFILRPLGVVATILGSGLFVVSYPFAAMGGNSQSAYDNMVKAPASFTFTRALGDF